MSKLLLTVTLVEGELSPSLHRHDAVEPVGTVELLSIVEPE